MRKNRPKDFLYILDRKGLSRKIYSVRRRTKMTQREVAEYCSCATLTISKTEKMRKDGLSKSIVQKLSELLEFDFFVFFGDEEYTKRRDKMLEYKVGQKIVLDNGSECEVVKVLENSVIVSDENKEMRLIGKGEGELLRKMTFTRANRWF